MNLWATKPAALPPYLRNLPDLLEKNLWEIRGNSCYLYIKIRVNPCKSVGNYSPPTGESEGASCDLKP